MVGRFGLVELVLQHLVGLLTRVHPGLPQLHLVVMAHAFDLLLEILDLFPKRLVVVLILLLGRWPKLIQVSLLVHVLFVDGVELLTRLDQLLFDAVAAGQMLLKVALHLFTKCVILQSHLEFLGRWYNGQLSLLRWHFRLLINGLDELTLGPVAQFANGLLFEFGQVGPEFLEHCSVEVRVVTALIVRIKVLLLRVGPC